MAIVKMTQSPGRPIKPEANMRASSSSRGKVTKSWKNFMKRTADVQIGLHFPPIF